MTRKNADEHEKKLTADDEEKKSGGDEGESGETGGTSSGEIHFRYKDILSTVPRDDVLPDSEIKRLLIVHQDLHKDRVDKQKAVRKERQALKEGRTKVWTSYDEKRMGRGFSGGSSSPYKSHPITNKAQFSGIDRQVTSLPTENQAETNSDLRDQLENQNRNVLRHSPKFNPKPRPY
jgi:hypothetical protein